VPVSGNLLSKCSTPAARNYHWHAGAQDENYFHEETNADGKYIDFMAFLLY
jgi:hypothetical protein